MYRFQASKLRKAVGHANLFGSGITVPIALKAAEVLEKDYGVSADIWSVTSYTELRRDGLDCERHNLLHPTAKAQVPYVAEVLKKSKGVYVASSDNMKALADGIRQWVPGQFHVLGTDGFGRSERRSVLRDHFEIDHRYMVIAALNALAKEGTIKADVVSKAIKDLGINVDKINPHLA